MRTSRLVFCVLLLGASCNAAAGAADTSSPPPNVVLIVADDLGYGDLGCYGGTDIPTPHIDSLAAQGIRLTNAYVSCPVCSPTRAGLMTGRYQQRFGHEFNVPPAYKDSAAVGLPLSQTTFVQVLQSRGYSTALTGKWHLGWHESFHPQRRGFDEFYGFLGGARPYIPGNPDAEPVLRGTTEVDEQEYLTDAIAREAVSFIGRHGNQPFCLYLAFNAVHAPLQAPSEYRERFAHLTDDKRQTYAAMLSAMDDGIGRILAALSEQGLDKNTLIVFLSDNGGPPLVNGSRNAPLSGAKGGLREGGIRVPMIVRWTDRLAQGIEYGRPVISLDIAPTILAAAEGDSPIQSMDGIDLLPYLRGANGDPPHARLYWRFGEQRAIRQGDWKLLTVANQAPKLFDLRADIAESRDLAKERPEMVLELSAAWADWNLDLASPAWQWRRAAPPDAAPAAEKK